MTENNFQIIQSILYETRGYTNEVIEATVIEYVCRKLHVKFCYEGEFSCYKGKSDKNLNDRLEMLAFPVEIEFIIEFFEALLEKNNVDENGIVFTPKYISDYIDFRALKNVNKYDKNIKILDPGCGCGVFLVSAVDYFHNKFGVDIATILNNNILGLDKDCDNVRRCKLVLQLYALINGENNLKLKPKIICADSLRHNWNDIFQVNGLDYIVGNPPYVNIHDMNINTVEFLKANFKTTVTGVFNIFYAFIEHAMKFLKNDGKLCYIIPNNFLTIKSAEDIRKFITENKYLECIIDFADNMVFKPVRTYNCIIELSKKNNVEVNYCVLEKKINIDFANLSFNKLRVDEFDPQGWKLVNRKVLENINKIEGQTKQLGKFVRTGIATLRDNVYIVDFDGSSFYKNLNGEKCVVEKNLVKRLYKIPDLKKYDDIEKCCKYIIFPYIKGKNGFQIIDEDTLKKKTPKTYMYLLKNKPELDKRDKGKANGVAWYAYGRSQGLNKYGAKLVFPTFANRPKFFLVNDEMALFCNGYAVFENDYMDLSIIMKVLNSFIMQYYISNTSYSIEGGYYCYQKRYIEKFSLPDFTNEEKKKILKMGKEELDTFLVHKYRLVL